MGKVKIPRKSVSLDMTAMCDIAFLLLNFFILTAKFKAEDPVVVDTPSSISELLLKQTKTMVISVDKDNHVFFGLEGQFIKESMVKQFAAQYKLPMSEGDVQQFSLMSTFGVPANQLPGLLRLAPADRNKAGLQKGIPFDSTDNQLRDWIAFARYAERADAAANNKQATGLSVAIKGDRATNYPTIKRIIAILQEQNINRFSLITNLEGAQ